MTTFADLEPIFKTLHVKTVEVDFLTDGSIVLTADDIPILLVHASDRLIAKMDGYAEASRRWTGKYWSTKLGA